MKLIPLSGKYGKGKFAMVDDERYEEFAKYKWRLNHKGYAVTTVGEQGKRWPLYLHWLVIDCPKGLVRDHINRDKLDNQFHNFRIVTLAENFRNRPRSVHYRFGDVVESIYVGTVWVPYREKWQAQTSFGGKTIWLGYYKKEEFAAFVVNMFHLLIGRTPPNYTPYQAGLYP